MSRRFKIAFLVIVAAQVFLLLGLIGEKEYTVRTGTEVVLETAPIDPRSLLQGDFAILGYTISDMPTNSQIPVGETMYVSLREAGEVWEGWNYNIRKPSDRDVVFIKGVVDRPGHLDFGIGTYFVPEGAGRLIERSRDVKVVVSVDGRGKAVIKDVLLEGVPFSEARELLPEE
jgi:uncharacterized membrane-anchored protein